MLGPYSDTLAEHAFTRRDPQVWRRMAERHRVAVLVEPAGGEPAAFDAGGESVPPESLSSSGGRMRAVRTAADGSRITFYWTLWSFRESHLPLLVGLAVLALAVVGPPFWFLQRQLQPLARLRAGVDAVARGDLAIRVPVVRDDEIGQVAGAFNVMARRVAEMLDERERLLADVSHELRSPLARMKVAVELMGEGDKRNALARDVREMEGLIAALLEREELRSRSGPMVGVEVDLHAIAGEAAAAFAGRKPGIELATRGEQWVRADPALMKLLMRNLIDNAVKFSRQDSGPVVVSLQGEDDRVILRVADDGIGIPEGWEEKLFEPFAKADRSRGHHLGYGIGLSLCRRIVQLHGGTIRLRRRAPNGTEAMVLLPRRPGMGDKTLGEHRPVSA